MIGIKRMNGNLGSSNGRGDDVVVVGDGADICGDISRRGPEAPKSKRQRIKKFGESPKKGRD